MIIKGMITQTGEITVDGYICKDDLKFNVTFKLDTGFTGIDIAIPSNISQELKLNPSREVPAYTASGSITLETGDDADLCLGNKVYRGVSYVIYYESFPLISITFLRQVSDMILIDFTKDLVTVCLS